MAQINTLCNSSNIFLVEEAKEYFRTISEFNPTFVYGPCGRKMQDYDYAAFLIESILDNRNKFSLGTVGKEYDSETAISDDSEPEVGEAPELQEQAINAEQQYGEPDSPEDSPVTANYIHPIGYPFIGRWIKINGEVDTSLMRDKKIWLGMRPLLDVSVGPNNIPEELNLLEVQNMWPFNQMWSVSIPTGGIGSTVAFGLPFNALEITIHPMMCWYFLRKLYSQSLPAGEMDLRSVLAIAKYIEFSAEAILDVLMKFGTEHGIDANVQASFRGWITENTTDPIDLLEVGPMAADSTGSLLEDPAICRLLAFQEQVLAMWTLTRVIKERILSSIDKLEAEPQSQDSQEPSQGLFKRMFADCY